MRCAALVVAVILAATSWAAAAPADVVLSLIAPPQLRCMAAEPCTLQLDTRGGHYPLRWRLADGLLPPGLALDPESGAITGTPDTAGEHSARIEVRDSSRPPQQVSRSIVIVVESLLRVEWKALPALHDTVISGALRVTNRTADEIELTVIVVAVNQIGKAFTLGYQHFPLRPNRTSPDIPFGSLMPSGRYKVHADAVGEVYDKHRIYRAMGESGPFVVP